MDDKIIKILEVLEVLYGSIENEELNNKNSIEESQYAKSDEEYEKMILQYKKRKYSRYL